MNTDISWHAIHYAGNPETSYFGVVNGSRMFVVEWDNVRLGVKCSIIEDGCEKLIYSTCDIESGKRFCESYREFRQKSTKPIVVKENEVSMNANLNVTVDVEMPPQTAVSGQPQSAPGQAPSVQFHFDIQPGMNALTFDVQIHPEDITSISRNDLGKLFKLERIAVSGSNQCTLVFSPATPQPDFAKIDGKVVQIKKP